MDISPTSAGAPLFALKKALELPQALVQGTTQSQATPLQTPVPDGGTPVRQLPQDPSGKGGIIDIVA